MKTTLIITLTYIVFLLNIQTLESTKNQGPWLDVETHIQITEQTRGEAPLGGTSPELLIATFFVFCLSSVLLVLPVVVAPKTWRTNKTSSYECGFEPFFGSKKEDLHFVAIGIAYIIFDIELLLLGPEIILPHSEGGSSLILVTATALIVIIGTILEIAYGALYWPSWVWYKPSKELN